MQTFKTVDVDAFVYKPPTKTPSGGTTIYINASATDRSSPRFQLADKMRAPFGIRDPLESAGPRKNMELSLDDTDLCGFLDVLDARSIKEAAKHSAALFKKELNADQIATMFRSTAKPGGDYAPLLRVKVNGPGSRSPTRIFVADTVAPGKPQTYSPGTIDDCPPNSYVTPVVEVGGVYVINRACGTSLTCTELLVYPPPSGSEAFPFVLALDPTP